ncbi:Tudor, plant [Spatholobus suberectus]|nr:Tudor, plant [Spatholobus suberectus]
MPDLPFQVGDLAESRSFQCGFRGAWFRCKIRDIRMKNAVVSHLLEYFDYPDQKLSWIKLYQKSLGKSKGSNRELMLRPSFPTVYYESEKLDVNTISEVIVIVNNIWKVGDLVDWHTDDCYWSGSVTKILGNDKVQIDLLPPPLGEGSTYEAFSRDLRPSLDWCPEKGWTVPMPMEDGCRQPCARIVNPANSDGIVKVGQPTVRTYSSPPSQNLKGLLDCPYRSMARRKQCNIARNGMGIDESDSKVERACFSDNVSSSYIMNASIENLEKATINGGYNEYPTKKRSNRSLCLNSMSSNTIEAAIMDLEELVNRIKWLRGVLNLRVPLSDTKQPSWEFSQHHAPCK